MADENQYPRVSGSTRRWHLSGVGSPVGKFIPEFPDQIYFDTDGHVYWRSFSRSADDWEEINAS